ncbi:hypothetical protein [Methylobacter svalbardensis]|uniref:hypothetical protein n=1 Tax=Methylobacter svalbardensis TaxID=3080016 RepID=UPI0030EF4DF0
MAKRQQNLEGLWNKLCALFDSESVHSSIKIELPSEELRFCNIEELKKYSDLPNKIDKFSIWLNDMDYSKGEKNLSITTKGFLDNKNTVHAQADSEAWCAGAIETTYTYLNTYKVWYSWFNNAPVGWYLFFAVNIPNICYFFLPRELLSTIKTELLIWTLAIITIGFLFVFKAKLFPGSLLIIKNNESWIRKNSAEIGLTLGLLSFIATTISVIIGIYK